MEGRDFCWLGGDGYRCINARRDIWSANYRFADLEVEVGGHVV
jgi:hypothetical protein